MKLSIIKHGLASEFRLRKVNILMKDYIAANDITVKGDTSEDYSSPELSIVKIYSRQPVAVGVFETHFTWKHGPTQIRNR